MAETTAHLVDRGFPPLPVQPDPLYGALLK
jgi:hypothetical protein